MDVLSFSTIAEQIKKEINHKCGLNLSQTRILLFFEKNKNKPLAMGNLAKDLNISLSTLSRQLQQKKTQAFIDVIRSNGNSSKSVCLNKMGLAKVKELEGVLLKIEEELFAALDEDDAELFRKELAILTESSYALD